MISSPRRGKQLADKVYQDIKDDIFEFRLLPGDRFSENEMAQRTGASRTPVREALFRLEREGYVEVSPRNGWQVKPFDFHYFEELYDVRTVLECAAVRRLCELENLADTLQPLMSLWGVPEDQRLRDISGVLNLDENFHSELVRTAGNGEMTRIHQNITERLRIIRRLDFTKRRAHRCHLRRASRDSRDDSAPAGGAGADHAQGAHRGEPQRGSQNHPAHALRGTASR